MLAVRVLDDLMDNGWDERQDGNFVTKRGRYKNFSDHGVALTWVLL